MNRAAFTLAACLIFAGAIPAQDLPPGVLLLSRVKRHVKEELQRLPNISCLETAQREYQPAKGVMRPLDTVRLEVLTDGEKELFSAPGDRKFSEQHPINYAGSGVLDAGLFGVYLKDILVTGNVTNVYKGEEQLGGRRLARWDYRLPLMWSGHTIQMPEGSGTVGFHGSFWADPQTYDVARLELIAEDFPPSLPLAEMVTSINYARTSLGNDLALLLPESAESRMVKLSGETNHNRIGFSNCRVFEAQSTINFDAPDSIAKEPRFGATAIDDPLRPLPAGLDIGVKLTTPLTVDMAVGAMIEGVVAANAPRKGPVVIAAGSPVRGRIRRLEKNTDPFPYFVVALEFTEVELQGIRHRFFANVTGIEAAPGVERMMATPFKTEDRITASGSRNITTRGERLSLPNLPGVASFFFRGEKLKLPQGFRTSWITLPPER
jgi:hypothetical protein